MLSDEWWIKNHSFIVLSAFAFFFQHWIIFRVRFFLALWFRRDFFFFWHINKTWNCRMDVSVAIWIACVKKYWRAKKEKNRWCFIIMHQSITKNIIKRETRWRERSKTVWTTIVEWSHEWLEWVRQGIKQICSNYTWHVIMLSASVTIQSYNITFA